MQEVMRPTSGEVIAEEGKDERCKRAAAIVIGIFAMLLATNGRSGPR